ncbi:MAG: ATP-grasp domain-containing protein [Bacteroidales bacterium]|nr:ATP-grasp domain-containing protein [Bacteroidales bacterium]
MDKEAIMIFGVGPLQQSIIERCKLKGLYTIGIDPAVNAVGRDTVDLFEVIDGQDYERTLNLAKKYRISGIITAATDKPLVMMARIAETLQLPFYSVETAQNSTDKFLMKKKFQEYKIACAKGYILNNIKELSNIDIDYPVIIKPRDNSGSRGVFYCKDYFSVESSFNEVLQYTKKGSILIEEYIKGKEYSVESVHYEGKTYVVQITEKITTEFPYNVELGHIQPAELTDDVKNRIVHIVFQMSKALNYQNCVSHTELKINLNNITIIEVSPRLGGDFITSKLVPFSTGIYIEDLLIDISVGNRLNKNDFIPKINKSSGIVYFELSEGKICQIGDLSQLNRINGIEMFTFLLSRGDIVNKIKNSMDRYGFAIFKNDNREELLLNIDLCKKELKKQINII